MPERRMPTAVAAAASVVLVCGGVAGLAVHQHGHHRSGLRVVGPDPLILVLGEPSGDSDFHLTAMLSGRVAYLPNEGCLVLAHDSRVPIRPDGSMPEPAAGFSVTNFSGVYWPYGSKPIKEGDRHGVQIPKVGTVWDGDTIQAGGGAMMESEIPVAAAALAPLLPTNCTRGLPGDFWDITVVARGPVTTSPPVEPAPPVLRSWHLVRANDATLDIDIDGNTCAGPSYIDVSETATSVTLRVSSPMAPDGCPGEPTTDHRTVPLLAPLGSRTLLHATADPG